MWRPFLCEFKCRFPPTDSRDNMDKHFYTHVRHKWQQTTCIKPNLSQKSKHTNLLFKFKTISGQRQLKVSIPFSLFINFWKQTYLFVQLSTKLNTCIQNSKSYFLKNHEISNFLHMKLWWYTLHFTNSIYTHNISTTNNTPLRFTG